MAATTDFKQHKYDNYPINFLYMELKVDVVVAETGLHHILWAQQIESGFCLKLEINCVSVTKKVSWTTGWVLIKTFKIYFFHVSLQVIKFWS